LVIKYVSGLNDITFSFGKTLNNMFYYVRRIEMATCRTAVFSGAWIYLIMNSQGVRKYD